MARFFEGLYGSDKAIKRNGVMVIISTLILYVISAILWTKGGWGAAFAPLLVALVVDALCIAVWLSLRSQRR
ncbi:hypothetical protein ACFV1A_16150 [Streptomyces seoulensis]|uniref:Uncharacterized protein n=1 Tax=Streptomyces seoulensis TaxID=73044 RepID=A0A4P6U1E9_STRSO|nr:hypothetical protein [Streptomyces seoulensis]QBJ92972.1 hypothetical protein D0Z67_23600 [Streptomyces seoulensis]